MIPLLTVRQGFTLDPDFVLQGLTLDLDFVLQELTLDLYFVLQGLTLNHDFVLQFVFPHHHHHPRVELWPEGLLQRGQGGRRSQSGAAQKDPQDGIRSGDSGTSGV